MLLLIVSLTEEVLKPPSDVMFNDPATTEIDTLTLHYALPAWP